ncbi:MAG: hypothetical protein JWO56_208, partial [Acidobacteria bacterium]|nr:hypothetical protein [Acidobacteriota bacterium]
TFVLAEDANGFIPLATGSRHQYYAVASGPNAGLWATDGTVAGTQRITGVIPSAAPGAVIEDTLFFGGDDGTQRELWRSDATPASTRLLKNIANDTDSSPAAFAKLGDILLFHAYDTEHGSELYRTDGTPGGTTLVKDIRPGAASSRPDQVASLGGIALFVADDGMHGRELWRTDGTADGTRLVREINPGGNAFYAFDAPGIVVRDGIGYFAATDGKTSSLWRSDGTDGGTFALKAGGGDPILYDNAIVFASTTGLWRTDGTLAGTTQLTMAACSWPTAVGTKLFFIQGGENWVLDSPAATARLVKDINPNGSSSDGTPFRAALNGLLIFTADDGTHGKELWRSDGTAEGTLLLKDIRPGSGDAIVTGISEQPFVVLGSRFYFAANDGVHGAELWSTDGTEAGTRMVADLAPGPTDSWPDDMTVSGGRVWFSAFDPGHGRELWSVTGSELTRYDIVAGPGGSAPGNLYPFAGAVYFHASTPATGSELWKMQTSAPARRRAAR